MAIIGQIFADPRQHSHSWFRILPNSWPYFTLSWLWKSCSSCSDHWLPVKLLLILASTVITDPKGHMLLSEGLRANCISISCGIHNALLYEIIISRLIKEYHAFHETQTFITVLTKARLDPYRISMDNMSGRFRIFGHVMNMHRILVGNVKETKSLEKSKPMLENSLNKRSKLFVQKYCLSELWLRTQSNDRLLWTQECTLWFSTRPVVSWIPDWLSSSLWELCSMQFVM
jgi:hypothetical protein